VPNLHAAAGSRADFLSLCFDRLPDRPTTCHERDYKEEEEEEYKPKYAKKHEKKSHKKHDKKKHGKDYESK
jgi:hypothetical protein